MMIETLALAAAIAAGMELRRVAMLAASVLAPIPSLLLVAYAIWRGRRPVESRAALLCAAAAAELRAGASLRRALEVSARSVGCVEAGRLAGAGAPLAEVADAIGMSLPDIRAEIELTLVAAQRSGARIADLLDEIGGMAIARDEVAREVRIATSPVKATLLVFAAAPLAYLAWRGGISPAASSSAGVASLAGAVLFIAGLALATTMVRRSA